VGRYAARQKGRVVVPSNANAVASSCHSLTTRAQEQDSVEAFAGEADDGMSMLFNPKDFTSRIPRVLRRSADVVDTVSTFLGSAFGGRFFIAMPEGGCSYSDYFDGAGA
jgi:hypothetical protein